MTIMLDLHDYTVSRSSTLICAIEVIERNHSRTAIVVEDGKVVGVLSEGDILRALLQGSDVYSLLDQHMQLGFCYLRERSLTQAFGLILSRGITLIPVVDDEFQLLGLVTLTEVLEWLQNRAQT
jgi:CBS domain-containing protein